MVRGRFICLEILFNAFCNGIGISGSEDGYLDSAALAETIKPCEKLSNSLIRGVGKYFVEVINEDISNVIVAGMQTGEETAEKLCGIYTVLGRIDKTCGMGKVISEGLVLFDADYIAALFLESIGNKLNESLGLAAALGSENKFNHSKHAPLVSV